MSNLFKFPEPIAPFLLPIEHNYCGQNLVINRKSNGKMLINIIETKGDIMLIETWCPNCEIVVGLPASELLEAIDQLARDLNP